MANYRVVVDDVDVEEWHRLFDRFADACIHQSWAFGAGKWGKRRVSHLLLYDGEKLVAAAQVILVTLPVVRGGIAHCKFGPMWQ